MRRLDLITTGLLLGGAGLVGYFAYRQLKLRDTTDYTLLPSGATMASKQVEAYTAGRSSTITVFEVRPGSGKFLEQRAAQAFQQMDAAALSDGVQLIINSAFRSMAEQVTLYAKYLAGVGNLAAKPGYSNHQNGIALDLEATPAAFAWLTANASRFGFIRTVKSESWHWEYHPGQQPYIA